MSKHRSKSPDYSGLHMLPRLSPYLISTAAPSAAAMSRHDPHERALRSPAPPGGTPMLYSKMQAIVQKMLHSDHGVPIKSYKRRLISAIPSAFTGADAVAWLMTNLSIESKAEAIHFANMLVQHGFFFCVEGSVPVRDDGTLFRFQTPYYWPSQSPPNSDFDYGVYLVKQVLRSKHKIRLVDHELTNLHKLKLKLSQRWKEVTENADEAVKIFREQKRVAKAIISSQEEAFWRLQRPPPGESSLGHSLLNRHFCERPIWFQQELVGKALRNEVRFLKRYVKIPRVHISIAIESLMGHCSKYKEFDPLLTPVLPSNPWLSGDDTLWAVERSLMEQPSEWQLKRWACSFTDLLNDVTGRYHFEKFCKSQYCSENIKFWQACRDLRYIPLSAVEGSVRLIYDEYLQHGASSEVNVSAKVQDEVERDLKNPSRYSFTAAQEQVFQLMHNDIYPRFVKSPEYMDMMKKARDMNSQGKGLLSRLRVGTHTPTHKAKKALTLAHNSDFTSPCLPERFTKRQLSISRRRHSSGGAGHSSASFDDIFLAVSSSPTGTGKSRQSAYTEAFIDALMAPGGRPLSYRRESAPSTSIRGGFRQKSNDSAMMDQVFEEEEEIQIGVGVEPVLSTSYSCDDMTQLREEATVGSWNKYRTPNVLEPHDTLKPNGTIPSSRSIPYQLSDQRDDLLQVPNFSVLPPRAGAVEMAASPRGTTSFEFESIDHRKGAGGFLSSTESMHSTAST